MTDINSMIRSSIQQVYRRAYIKRRDATTGLFESTWYEITRYVKSWGSYSQELDYQRLGTINIGGTNLVVSNVEGKFNPSNVDSSLWYGYADQQRTQVKIDAGFIHQTLASSGVWINTEYPGTSLFTGIISGDIISGTKGQISLPIKDRSQIFKDFPAKLLLDFTTTGQTSSRFVTAQLRDQTAGTGSYVFRPFFDDTTSSWAITATTTDYTNLATSTATRISSKSVWEVIEDLATCELFYPTITKTGVFTWGPKTVGASSVFTFNGVGASIDTTYGTTIKDVARYGKKTSNYYSRVVVRFDASDTITSYCETSTAIAISGTNNPWNLGYRTFDFTNVWLPGSTTAAAVASALLTELSANTEEIEFTATLVPHVNVLDKITVSYDPTPFESSSVWDLNDWDTQLTWSSGAGDAVVLNNASFKVLSVEVDLDALETRIVGKLI